MESDDDERQVTRTQQNHILTNTAVWSPDSQWIVYDVRSDPAGARFDGTRIERVHVETGVIQVLYQACQDACVGVVTCSPVDERVVFIHGPEQPAADWSYSACHRQGFIVNAARPGTGAVLDARDVVPPFTPGALRGGTHVHTFDANGSWIAFTYEDHVLAQPGNVGDFNQRNIGVSVPGMPVTVPRTHPRNLDGTHFSVLVTRTENMPWPGSDDISRAFEEAWVGQAGYARPDGSRQRRALAFQGLVVTTKSETIAEVFIVDLPDDVTTPGDGPLQGTADRRPYPPKGVVQRRLTFTAERKHPGIQGPRHWLRSSPDGEQIAFLMKDDNGIVQLWTVDPNGGPARQLSHHPWNIASAFTWSPDGRSIAHGMDGSIFLTDAVTGEGRRLTEKAVADSAPRPEACVFSPDGTKAAYAKPVRHGQQVFNQIFVAMVR